MRKSSTCKHNVLQLTPSPFAELAGFEQPDPKKRIAATVKSGRAPPSRGTSSSSSKLIEDAQILSQAFPGPLVLPHDALNYDPDGDEPAQSFKSWFQEKHRNKVTSARQTLYVGAPPSIDPRVKFMRDWVTPNLRKDEPAAKRVKKTKGNKKSNIERLTPPTVDEAISYLGAFYHGMPVKRLPIDLQWTAWQNRDVPSVNGVPNYVALGYGKASTRVRARVPPDGMFPAQLNLDDIIDAAMAMLPNDAYAIVLLVDHDIYESPDDDFCAGRAYGGSRVSVVQSARYNPLLDERIGIRSEHAWPMSHCKCVVDELCAVEEVEPKAATATETRLSKTGAMRAAVDAVANLKISDSKTDLEALWSSRVLRTVSHELG